MPDLKKELEPRKPEANEGIQLGQAEMSPAVESWMELIEKKFARIPNDTPTPMDDTVVVQPPAQANQPPVTLPINHSQMVAGKKAGVEEGLAWLVTWVVRQIKVLSKLGRKARLQDIPEAK